MIWKDGWITLTKILTPSQFMSWMVEFAPHYDYKGNELSFQFGKKSINNRRQDAVLVWRRVDEGDFDIDKKYMVVESQLTPDGFPIRLTVADYAKLHNRYSKTKPLLFVDVFCCEDAEEA
jgi:hypothetical protein